METAWVFGRNYAVLVVICTIQFCTLFDVISSIGAKRTLPPELIPVTNMAAYVTASDNKPTIIVDWDPLNFPIDGYYVYYKTLGHPDFLQLSELITNQTWYMYEMPTYGATYEFVVYTQLLHQLSEASDVVTAFLPVDGDRKAKKDSVLTDSMSLLLLCCCLAIGIVLLLFLLLVCCWKRCIRCLTFGQFRTQRYRVVEPPAKPDLDGGHTKEHSENVVCQTHGPLHGTYPFGRKESEV